MGITESTVVKDNNKQAKGNSFFFYDVYRNSGEIIVNDEIQHLPHQKHQKFANGPPDGKSRTLPPPLASGHLAGSLGPLPYLSGDGINGIPRNSSRSDYYYPSSDDFDYDIDVPMNCELLNNNNDEDTLREPFRWKDNIILNQNRSRTASRIKRRSDGDRNCNYTCHQQCSSLVKLNCKTTHNSDTENEIVELKAESPKSPLLLERPSGPELKQKIVIYNANAQGFEMELQEDGETFHGFIRVHMNLTRPINVLAGTRPPSIYDIIYEEEDTSEKTLTSFYLPRDTVKAVHITSETTTQELISALLQKFKVVDNPRKFCLYEKYWDWEGSVKGVLRRMQDDERPLWLALTWGIENVCNRKLVLQENDTGDIAWDAFSLPELKNFLKILDREEEEYLNQVRQNYKKMEERLKETIENFEMNRLPDEDPFTNM